MKKIFKFIANYWQFSLTLIVGTLALILTFVSNQMALAQWIVSTFVAIIALIMFIDMIKTLRSGSYGIDILAITAIAATVAVGQYWASLVIVIMLTGGEVLEDFAAKRARQELSALIARVPQIAHLSKNKSVIDVPVSSVKINDVLIVRPHEVIPVDGELLSKNAELDESSLTGESVPVQKKIGDPVMSGSLNGALAIEIRATATAANSQYEQIIKLVKEAESQPAPFVRLADRYAVPFTLIAYLIAGLAWYMSGEPVRFAEVLVVASPCPLILAAPIALISGMSRASRHGIIIKNGAVIERLAKSKTFTFDKTGTLTDGHVTVSNIKPVNNMSPDHLLRFAASAEIASSHVLATSLVEYAKSKKLKLYNAKNIREIAGDGVFATVDKHKVLVGRAEFLVKNKARDFDAKAYTDDSTGIFVAIDSQFAGVIYFSDKLRPDSRRTISELKALGVRETVMLTGDRPETAQRIAKSAGISQVFSKLLPKDKLQIVQSLSKNNQSVVMVGDGINDAPVLAAASVGVAMGARGSTAASESADAVIILDDISRVTTLYRISKQTMHIALQSVWVGIALCVVLMIIAAFGKIPALMGAGLQELIDVTVIVNALRAHRS